MKIEGNRPNPEASATRLDGLRADRSARAGRQGGSEGDRVELSADAELVGSAMKAAEQAPVVRQDVVDRARQKLLAGEIGTDVERLADRLIDNMLGR